MNTTIINIITNQSKEGIPNINDVIIPKRDEKETIIIIHNNPFSIFFISLTPSPLN